MASRKLSVASKKFKIKMNNLTIDEENKLLEVKELAIELMELHNVSHFEFRFGYGWKYRGKCTHCTITIQYLYAIKKDINEIKNTILHEIAHAIVGVHIGHRKVWQLKAQEIGVNKFYINYRK